MKISKTILSLVLFFSFICWANAQYEVRHIASDFSKVDDVYSLEINNRSGENRVVRLQVSLRQESALVYEATTNQFTIMQPLSVINSALIQPISITRNNIEEWNGDFLMEIRLIDQNGQTLLADRLRITATENSLPNNSIDRKRDLVFGGQARIYGQISDMQGVGSFVPRQYLRAEIHPDLTFKSIPVGLDILLSTEQNAFRQSMNQVALRFDAQQFKQLMRRKLQDKVKKVEVLNNVEDIEKLQSLREEITNKKFPDLEKWKSQIKDPEILAGLQKLKQVEAIDQIVNSPEVKKNLLRKVKLEAINNLDSAKSEELKKLQSFEAEIQKLRAKAEGVRPLVQKYKQFKDLQQRIKKANTFAKRDIMKDPDFLKKGLKSFNVISRGQEVLNGFDAITVGTTYPYFSRLSLSSLSVDGLNVEWNPGKFYLATTFGRSARQTINTDFRTPELTLSQRTIGAKAGYGNPFDNHFHLVFVDVKDNFDIGLIENPTKPQSNRLIGTDAQFSLFNKKITLGGELMTSLLTRDNTIETDQIQEFKTSDIPLSSLMGNINASSSFDIAWRAYADFDVFKNSTKLKTSIERVGPNYFSLGAPTLLNDIIRWKVEGSQSLFNNKLRVSAFAREDNNNLDPLLVESSSTIRSFGISGSLNIPKYPSLNFSYAPYAQDNRIVATDENLSTNATLLSINLGYPYKLTKDIQAFTQLTYLSHDLDSNIPGIDYNLKMYGINQNISYRGSNLNLAINYTPNQIIGDKNQEVLTINTSGTVQFKKWNNSIGIQYLNIKDSESRTGYYIDSSYPITSFADLQVRVQRNIYASTIDDLNNYNDIIAWGGLRFRW